MSPGASHPWLERAIKCSGARHRIQAIFPSRGRSGIFLSFFSFLGQKRERRRKDLPWCCPAPAPVPFARPPLFICLSPGTVRRHPQLPGVASCSGYIVTCSVSPGLCPLLAGRNSPGFTFSSAKWIDGPQTSKMGPFQVCFLQAWVYQGRMRGSSGVAEKPSQKQRN